jgi:hypothetical protein
VTWEDVADRGPIVALQRRHAGSPTQTRCWLVDQVLADDLRILFWVRDVQGVLRGHVGLSAIDLDAGSATIVDVLAGEAEADRLVALAVATLEDWTRTNLKLKPMRASHDHSNQERCRAGVRLSSS